MGRSVGTAQTPTMSSLDAIREGYARFEPHAYLHNNYVPPRADFSSEECVVPWKLRCLAETFASGGETEARGGGARSIQLSSPIPCLTVGPPPTPQVRSVGARSSTWARAPPSISC